MQDKVSDGQVSKPDGILFTGEIRTRIQEPPWDWNRASGFAESDVVL